MSNIEIILLEKNFVKLKGKKMTVVYGYIRASTVEEVKQGSNQSQRELIEKFCKEKCYELKIYEDQAKSGASTDRPTFQKMMS